MPNFDEKKASFDKITQKLKDLIQTKERSLWALKDKHKHYNRSNREHWNIKEINDKEIELSSLRSELDERLMIRR